MAIDLPAAAAASRVKQRCAKAQDSATGDWIAGTGRGYSTGLKTETGSAMPFRRIHKQRPAAFAIRATPAEFAATIAAESVKWGEVIRKAGIKKMG